MSEAPSGNFNTIAGYIDPNTRRTFTVTGYIQNNGVDDRRSRTLCPHVLGYLHNGSPNETQLNERILCWELVGPGTVPGWRCYKVTKLVGITPSGTAWVMGTGYSRHQNSVQNDVIHVPYP